jgi:ferredoxin-NADP reductase
MTSIVVKILDTFFVTHDVKCFRVEKPEGYTFIPGQATDISINLESWKDKIRPFTFTNLPEDNYLEFMIKIYRDHEGVTNKLGSMNAGGELILHDVFGAIRYKGEGVFIAAGSGITPFISIFRDLHKKKKTEDNLLIYTNKTSEDVIMGKELSEILKDNFTNVYTREKIIGFTGRRIDRNFLIENIVDFNQHFYLCGPDDFVKSVSRNLIDLGATSETLVIEK